MVLYICNFKTASGLTCVVCKSDRKELNHCQQVWRHNAGISAAVRRRRAAQIGSAADATANFSGTAPQRGYVFRPLGRFFYSLFPIG